MIKLEEKTIEGKDRVIVTEKSETKDDFKGTQQQKLVWREDTPPIIHVVRGRTVKIDENFTYFEGEKKGLLIIPNHKVEEIK